MAQTPDMQGNNINREAEQAQDNQQRSAPGGGNAGNLPGGHAGGQVAGGHAGSPSQSGAQAGGQPPKPRIRIKKSVLRAAVLTVGVMVILLVAWMITGVIHSVAGEVGADSSAVTSVSVAASESAPASQPEAASVAPGPEEGSWNFIGPVPQTINNMQLVTPDYRMIALPTNGRVDMSYFDTVTFVGDSLTQGLELYKTQGIPNAHYCAYKGVGPKQIYDGSLQRRADGVQEIPMDALRDSQPDNIYIQLGANAMVHMDDESILTYYAEMLDYMQTYLDPRIGYYIQSLTPVRPDNKPGFDTARIQNLNNALAKLAWEKGIYFIDLCEPLAGDDGFLREEYAGSDGYHLSPTGYAAWVEYLVTHTAYHARNPYLEGSGFHLTEPAFPAEEPPVVSTPAEAAPAEGQPAEATPASVPTEGAPAEGTPAESVPPEGAA